MRTGTKVKITFIRPEGDVTEAATIARTTPEMQPLPPGYLPVRFAADGGVVLVHRERISEAL